MKRGGHRLTVHPPDGFIASTPSCCCLYTAEFFLFVLFFDFRRRHWLRKGQREGVSVAGRGLAALLHVGFAFQHHALRGKYALNRPHPDPSPVSGD